MSKLLPNTLESLTIHPQDACNSFAEWATQVDGLPPNCYPLISAFPKLKSLVLKNANLAESVDFFSFLPSTLTSLEVGSYNQSPVHFSQLPRSLTYLAANPRIGYAAIDDNSPILFAHFDDLAQAPPEIVLTRVMLFSITEKNVHQLPKLPSKLLELTLNRYLPSMVSLLPRSLVKLVLDERTATLAPNTASTALLSMNWPPTLQELDVTFTSCTRGVLASLPRTLLRLKLLLVLDGAGFHSNELPPHLQELSIAIHRGHMLHILRFDGKLPSALTHLRMSDPIKDAPHFSASLPDSIESLSLSPSTRIVFELAIHLDLRFHPI